jgi:hypothetical protein
VAEQLTLDERRREGGAVDVNERRIRHRVSRRRSTHGTGAARAVDVDRAGEQALAGARLATKQHGGVGLGRAHDHLVDRGHLGRAADHVVEPAAQGEPD